MQHLNHLMTWIMFTCYVVRYVKLVSFQISWLFSRRCCSCTKRIGLWGVSSVWKHFEKVLFIIYSGSFMLVDVLLHGVWIALSFVLATWRRMHVDVLLYGVWIARSFVLATLKTLAWLIWLWMLLSGQVEGFLLVVVYQVGRWH